MGRAVKFYKNVFEIEPEKVDDRFSYFQLANTKLGLYNPDADGVNVAFGENCVPAFRTEDIESEHKKLSQIVPEIEDIQDKKNYSIFHFKDPEGNMIEVYEGVK